MQKVLLKPWLRDQRAGGGFVQLEGDTFVPEREAVILTEIGSVELSIDKQLLVFIDNLKEKFGTIKNTDTFQKSSVGNEEAG